jgi:hypothetical protein
MARETYGNPDVLSLPEVEGCFIISVEKNSQGDIEKFHLDDGTLMSYDEVCDAISKGDTKGLLLQKGNEGQRIIRSSPDSHKENNLDKLPLYE